MADATPALPGELVHRCIPRESIDHFNTGEIERWHDEELHVVRPDGTLDMIASFGDDGDDDAHGYAERAAACWNACMGIPTDALQRRAVFGLKHRAEDALVWLHLLNKLAHEYTTSAEYCGFIGAMNDLATVLGIMNGRQETADDMARRIMAEAQAARDREEAANG